MDRRTDDDEGKDQAGRDVIGGDTEISGVEGGSAVSLTGDATVEHHEHHHYYGETAEVSTEQEPWSYRLDDMPLDEVPEVGSLPPGSRMPFAANPLFTGRQEDLLAVAETLQAGGTVAVTQIAAVTGLGGIGKTQLAVEFVHRFGRYFPGGVHWLSFATAEGVPAEVVNCGHEMGRWPAFGEQNIEEQLRLVRSVWKEPAARLLVFDNLDGEGAEELLDEWRPKMGGVRVLVTSRRGQWDPTLGVALQPLDVLPREESRALLRRFRPSLSEDETNRVAAALGDLPLALHLAGSYLQLYEGEVTAAEYLFEWQEERLAHESMAGEWLEVKPAGREMNVFGAFMMSYGRLRPDNPIDISAEELLSKAAFFKPGEPIPWELLKRAVLGSSRETVDEKIRRTASRLQSRARDLVRRAVDKSTEAKVVSERGRTTQRRLVRARKRLLELGLVEVGQEGMIKVHRLVAVFVRTAVGQEPAQAEQEAVEYAVAVMAGQLNEAGDPRPLLSWQAHLRYITDQAAERQDEMAALLSNRLGYHLREAGDLAGARPYYEQYLAISDEVLGSDHSETATSLSNMGSLLSEMGDLKGAQPYYERSLAICEKVLGPKHRSTATSLNNMGRLLQEMGDLAGARPFLERALTIFEKVLGPEHPNTVASLNNMGSLLRDMGDLDGAGRYFEQALAIGEKVQGSEHKDTARGFNNMGSLLQAMGDLDGARPYYEKSLAICEKVLGPEHPITAGSLNNMGFLLKEMGDLDGARPYYERALAIWEKVLGPEHMNTRIVRGNLVRLDMLAGKREDGKG